MISYNLRRRSRKVEEGKKRGRGLVLGGLQGPLRHLFTPSVSESTRENVGALRPSCYEFRGKKERKRGKKGGRGLMEILTSVLSCTRGGKRWESIGYSSST